jgi:hypothetical protein
MKQKANGPQNPGVFCVPVKEGERLARFLIYFSSSKNRTRCTKYGRVKEFKFLGVRIFILCFIILITAFNFNASSLTCRQ